MPFEWSLNPYTGCAHRCTFCYVRAFEARADRPADDRYGRSIRIKVNVAEVLRRELGRASWKRESVAVAQRPTPTSLPRAVPADPRLHRRARSRRTPFSLITRGPMIRRDVDVLVEAARRAKVHVSFSVPTLDERIWRSTEPGTAPPWRRLETVRILTEAGIDCGVALAPLLPGLSDDPQLLADVVREARAAGATGIWANVLYLRPGTREHFLEALSRDWPSSSRATSACTRGAHTCPRPRPSRSARRSARSPGRRPAPAGRRSVPDPERSSSRSPSDVTSGRARVSPAPRRIIMWRRPGRSRS